MAAQLQAHHQAVHEMHREMTNNAEQSATAMNAKVSNKMQDSTTQHYIGDIKNAAAAKIADNNKHAQELHQLANTVTAANTAVQAKANELLKNAGLVAAHELHTQGEFNLKKI